MENERKISGGAAGAGGDPMRILHLSGRTFWCGESNRVVVVCRGLARQGHSVVVGAPAGTELARRAGEQDVRVDTRCRFARGFRPGSLWQDILRLRALQREERFEVIHLHTSTDTWTAALAFGPRGRAGRPLLVRTRHNNKDGKTDPVHRWLYGRRIDYTVLAAAGLRRSIAGLLEQHVLTEERLAVIHSSVDVHRFDPGRISGQALRRQLGVEDRFCIGLVGRLSVEKGHAQLLQAMPAVLQAEPRAVCVFVGDGEEAPRLRQAAAEGPLRDKVLFAGFREDIPEVVAAMDLMVAPSLTLEASPGVVKEAMAMGKPVIASDVGGVGEIIRHGADGWIIPPGDAAALREALVLLITRPELREALAARSRASMVEHFSDERLVENKCQFYRRILGRA